ncbi:hypothetical protein ACFQ1Q_09570 [Winogradskyella litorisediminis]|uniref:Outer membrane protein beta-barrel domain-containing protein n=1 Tax=Winogradskyella litorisediminis TaxID=1156618 RepID=A0ABW3N816_9FLAO
MNYKIHLLLLLFFSTVIVSAQSYQTATIEIEGKNIEVFILSESPIGFYKTKETNRYYIENKKNTTELVSLDNLSYPPTNGKNRGKLLVIFSDCVSVRSKASKSDLSEGRILALIEMYKNCESYTEDYELSTREKINQSYANQKSIVNYDFGAGYYNQELNFRLNGNRSLASNKGGISIYASANISPKHLISLTGRLFYDFSLQYNFNSTYDFGNFKSDISSLFVTVAPKYYLNKSITKLNPFIGASIGAAILNYDYTDDSGVDFSKIDGTDVKVIYGFHLGTELFDDFELSLNYYPDYKFNVVIDDTTAINSKFNSLNLNIGYKF